MREWAMTKGITVVVCSDRRTTVRSRIVDGRPRLMETISSRNDWWRWCSGRRRP